MERFAHIDVAEPRDDFLVRQRGLERGLLALARMCQHRRVEFVAERLGTERTQQRLAVELGAGDELHHAEASRIVEGNARARGHVEHDVIMSRVPCTFVIIAAGHGLAASMGDPKRARHAEMHHQNLSRGEIRE